MGLFSCWGEDPVESTQRSLWESEGEGQREFELVLGDPEEKQDQF